MLKKDKVALEIDLMNIIKIMKLMAGSVTPLGLLNYKEIIVHTNDNTTTV